MTEVTRRGLIQGLAALASLAVVPSSLSPLQATELDRFYTEAKSGRVVGKTFLLDEPLVLDGLHNLIIDRCTFITSARFKGDFVLLNRGCRNVCFVRCYFDARLSSNG